MSLEAEPTFRKMVIWDWYDGPETGLLICEKCQGEFYFFLVDWSDDHNIRVFALQQLKSGSVASLVRLVGEEPQWPIWMPNKLRFPIESDRTWIDRLDSLVLADRKAPSKVLAWDNTIHAPMRISNITTVNSHYAQKLLEGDSVASPFDWLEYLGMKR